MPAKVTVKVLGVLKDVTGWYSRVYELEGEPTVGKLLERLVAEYPKLKEHLEDPEAAATILVNGRDIEFLEGLKTRLRDGDTVAIIPPAGGG